MWYAVCGQFTLLLCRTHKHTAHGHCRDINAAYTTQTHTRYTHATLTVTNVIVASPAYNRERKPFALSNVKSHLATPHHQPTKSYIMTFRNSLNLHFLPNNMLMKHVNSVTMTTCACFIFLFTSHLFIFAVEVAVYIRHYYYTGQMFS